jgi:hypothetical protein
MLYFVERGSQRLNTRGPFKEKEDLEEESSAVVQIPQHKGAV